MKPIHTNCLNRLASAAMLCAVLGLGTGSSIAQVMERVLESFGYPGGGNPYAALIQGTDGAFYGTTYNGGSNGCGMVFKLSSDGAQYTTLHSFTGTAGDGANPYAGLVQGNDGALYGTTYAGGTNGYGTVFKLSSDGAQYTTLHSFTGIAGDGANPYAGLVQGADGVLYGTTYNGGTSGYGTVFKMSTDGAQYTTLYSFTGTSGDGANPYAGLVQGADGALYGTTYGGGTSSCGTVFTLRTDGSSYATLYGFTGSGGDGKNPYAKLIQSIDGTLYGTTYAGGTYGRGTVFKLSTNGMGYTPLYSFSVSEDNWGGWGPYAGLVQGSDGTLYGTTVYADIGNGVVFQLSTNGTGYTTLHSFSGAGGDGAYPYGLVQGSDGRLYGTTYGGGLYGRGEVFKLTTTGDAYTQLYSFGGDGVNPYAGLVQGKDGALYGTAYTGGTSNLGMVFKLNPSGAGYTMLHSFTGALGDGKNPYAGLVQGSDGTLYGTTYGGGTNGYGMVFKLSTNGTGYSPLYSFTGIAGDGRNPYGGLVQGGDGTLYGTTYGGGTNGFGMVFKLGTNGTGYTRLYSFTLGSGDGQNPRAGLVQGSDGTLYGTTYGGGTNGYGMVFKLGTNGTGYTRLYSFTSTGGDGKNPYAALVQGSAGVLYGTTYGGGVNGYGTVFKVGTNGTGYTRLYSFTGSGGDGKYPSAALVQRSDGALYGTTYSGGASNCGMVFKVSTNGTGYTQIYSFTGTGGDGKNPYAALVQGSDGALYGTTYSGGAYGYGTAFQLLIPPFTLELGRLPDQNTRLCTLTVPNVTLQLAASTNLWNWSTLTNIAGASGTVQLDDLAATNYPCRFYRAVWTH